MKQKSARSRKWRKQCQPLFSADQKVCFSSHAICAMCQSPWPFLVSFLFQQQEKGDLRIASPTLYPECLHRRRQAWGILSAALKAVHTELLSPNHKPFIQSFNRVIGRILYASTGSKIPSNPAARELFSEVLKLLWWLRTRFCNFVFLPFSLDGQLVNLLKKDSSISALMTINVRAL